MTCAQLWTKTRTSISWKICCVKSEFQILYVVEQFSSLFSKDKLKQGAHTPNPWSALPAHVVGELPCGSLPTAPTCVVLSWHWKDSPRQERVFYTRVFPGNWMKAMPCWWAPTSWRNRCPWLPLPAWYGCAYSWGNGQAVGWCMCAPGFNLLVTHDPPSPHMSW